jgi:hypothetical protein
MDVPARHAAAAILDEFAARTGLTSDAPPRRYLWTDAFAVYTWLGLGRLDLAKRLIQQVHEVLGVSRDPEHPMARGLRIGKPLPERAPDEPYDPDLEWERDGQYYHYLTKWMLALERTASATGEERYHRWAVELAQAAHRAFAYPPGAPTRLYWKMSVDLSRPLVPSMGMHDPLDGLVVMATLRLERETRELARMCEGRRWATDDPLGAGGLLLDALALARLVVLGGRDEFRMLLAQTISDAEVSVPVADAAVSARVPAAQRLAFRELGLALGLHGVPELAELTGASELLRFVPLAERLEEFWLDPAHQAAPSWTAHRDINAVTLTACLAPEGTLNSGQRP